MSVYVDKAESYDIEKLSSSVRRAFEELSVRIPANASVVLKPNIVGVFAPESAAVTHPNVAEAVIKVLREMNVGDITVAEGPGVGQDVVKAFKASGYADMCERTNVPLIDLNTAERVPVPWAFGELMLPKIILDAGCYINICKMKTHGQTKVTLSMKNQKGLLLPEDKKRFHMQWGLHKPIAELARIVTPHLSIVDGVIGMEGEGPLRGKKINSNVLVYGDNTIETDTATAMLMGFKPADIEHIRMGEEEGLGHISPKVSGGKIRDSKKNYAQANQQYGHVLKIYSWRNPYACSMCIQSFTDAIMLAVKNPKYWATKMPKLAYYALWMRLHLIQGKNACLPEMDGKVICFGNCTKKLAEEHGLGWIKGCPPKPEDILEAL
ncbi:MAG: DUF362 domain-containing protein [Candidatus Altiarchaeota archaeon]